MIDYIGLFYTLYITGAIILLLNRYIKKMNIFKDMDDNQYWMTLWSMAGTVVMAILGLIAYSSAMNDQQMQAAINQGHDPLELACLFNSGSESIKAPCLIIAQAKAKILLEQANVPE